eukprot:SAG31_NODE_9639_length_1247_cov_2.814460_1_plen_144_part_00
MDRGSAMRRRLVGPEAELVLQVRRSPGMGRGLYTLNPIKKGAVVATMDDPRMVSSETYATRLGYPRDAIVWHGKVGVFDQGFQQRPGYFPQWYRMNHAHASRANVAVRVQSTGTGLEWYAKVNVGPEEELKWDYGDHVPKEWN